QTSERRVGQDADVQYGAPPWFKLSRGHEKLSGICAEHRAVHLIKAAFPDIGGRARPKQRMKCVACCFPQNLDRVRGIWMEVDASGVMKPGWPQRGEGLCRKNALPGFGAEKVVGACAGEPAAQQRFK